MTHHPVAIIGGGLAGAACALTLRRAGIEAAVFDRDRFPRRKVCGAFLSPGAVDCLDALGILEEARAGGARPVGRARLSAFGRTIEVGFDREGLGFSRERLDAILARRAGVLEGYAVERVERRGAGFILEIVGADGDTRGRTAGVVVDAAGRLSRFTRRRPSGAYGVQFERAGVEEGVLEFEFFEGGYGGTVAVEGGRTNACFLVDRAAVRRFLGREDARVTGPIAYDAAPGSFMAIGDASGMIDPFSGEGMRHALGSGILAGQAIGAGLAAGLSCDAIRARYRDAWRREWGRKRRLTAALRWTLEHRAAARAASEAGSRFPSLAAAYLRALWK